MSIVFGKKYKRIAECHYIIESVNFVTNSFVASGIDRICLSSESFIKMQWEK